MTARVTRRRLSPRLSLKLSLPAIGGGSARCRNHLRRRREKGNGVSLNQASLQTVTVQAFARLSWRCVHRRLRRLARGCQPLASQGTPTQFPINYFPQQRCVSACPRKSQCLLGVSGCI